MKIINSNNASAFMLLNAILWGSSYIWSKILLGYLPYFTILAIFSLGGLAVLTVAYHKRIRTIARRTVLIGMSIGGFSILSNIFCMLALRSTSSSNTAFIVQMSVIITPLLMSVKERKFPGGRGIFSTLAAVAGLLFLTCDFSNFTFNPGDLFALANALFFSLYLASMKIYAGRTDPVQFTFIQHVISSIVFVSMAFGFEARQIDFAGVNIFVMAVLVLSIAISVSTILIQSSAIQFIRPEKATVIYTMEPVAAAVFAWLLLGERLSGAGAFIGCLLILIAIAVTSGKKHEAGRKRDVGKIGGPVSGFYSMDSKVLNK